MVAAYKDLVDVERDFRHIKVDDLDLRPIHHRLEARVRSHVFICMLAAYLVWHLREVLAPLTFTDENPPIRDNPVAPAVRSTSAAKKAASKGNGAGDEVRGFRELLDHFATLTRNTVKTATERTTEFELLSTLTLIQHRVFELLDAPVPRRLMWTEQSERAANSRCKNCLPRSRQSNFGLEVDTEGWESAADRYNAAVVALTA